MLKRTSRGATPISFTPMQLRQIMTSDPNNAAAGIGQGPASGAMAGAAAGAAGQPEQSDSGLLPWYLGYTQRPNLPPMQDEYSSRDIPLPPVMGMSGGVHMPSLMDDYNAAKAAAISAQPDAYGAQEAQLSGVPARNQMIERSLGELQPPTKQWNDYVPPAQPQREQIPIPQREAPKLDLMSAILAAIAGGVDTQGAGRYGAAPLDAGMSNANLNYNDAQTQYGEKTRQADQRYSDSTAARAEAIRTAIMNREGQSDADYTNQQTKYNAGVQHAFRAGDEASAEMQINGLRSLSGKARDAAQAESKAANLADQITTLRSLRAARAKASNDEMDNRLKVGKEVLDYGKSLNSTGSKDKQNAIQNELDLMRIKQTGRFQDAQIGFQGSNAGSNRIRALADLADKGFMLDGSGRVVRDPNAPKDDVSNLTKDEEKALTKARENFGSLYNELLRLGGQQGKAGEDLHNWVDSNPRLRGLSQQIKDLEGKSRGKTAAAGVPTMVYDRGTNSLKPYTGK